MPKHTLSLACAAAVLGLAGLAFAQAATGGVVRAAKPTAPGPANLFVGEVSVRPLATMPSPGRTSVAEVVFDAGERTHWHSHASGQTLYVTQGCGWTQREGAAVERICAGDTAYVAPNVKHWHGATRETSMTHLSILENIPGAPGPSPEPLSESQYTGPGAQAGERR